MDRCTSILLLEGCRNLTQLDAANIAWGYTLVRALKCFGTISHKPTQGLIIDAFVRKIRNLNRGRRYRMETQTSHVSPTKRNGVGQSYENCQSRRPPQVVKRLYLATTARGQARVMCPY